ncbi:MAG: NADH:flavin oxidoreductase/NADH oxidase [Deltaproteobacteria bacterium]|nr:NADH:flavin oxidoreductase/NADH oxidase [Deltaproteobacteria bacterium]
MATLFDSLHLRGVQLRNRIFLSPMCQYSARDGLAGPWHTVHYGTRAVGGVGLVMVEATAVVPEGRITPFDLGLWSDAHAAALEPIARFTASQGAVAGVQLAHSGRKGSCRAPWHGGSQLALSQGGWETVAPSPLAFRPGDRPPRELTAGELGALLSAYEAATARARAAGFQVVEVHMAHGYLLHEFLSPLSNRREDDCGGSWENRVRFPLAVAETVRKHWPEDRPVFVRLSATDWVEGGWDLDQSVRLARRLRELGVDLVDCSSAGLAHDATVPEAPGYQVPFADAVRADAGIPTAAVGRITEPRQAEAIVTAGNADAVSLGRELLRCPYWPLTAARELGVEILWPDPYLRAKPA